MSPVIEPLPLGKVILQKVSTWATIIGSACLGISLYDMFFGKGTDFLGLIVATVASTIIGALIGIVLSIPQFSALDSIRRGNFLMFPALVKAVEVSDVTTLRSALLDRRLMVRLAAMQALTNLPRDAATNATPEVLMLLDGQSPARPSFPPGTCTLCGTPLTRWNTELHGPKSGKCGSCLRAERGVGLSEAAFAAQTLGCIGLGSPMVLAALSKAAQKGTLELSHAAKTAIQLLSQPLRREPEEPIIPPGSS
jgi:hypothetical protein